ncbi:ABC transporter ATP-binding protein/permease [Candidatus Pelagibacter sp.]|nr:ABC transporter ATP-binding protein/permease [Candidatus Pelagibacter sp.]
MIKVFNQLKVLLDKKQKKNFIFLSILMVIFSLLEFLSIGIIIPISTLILDGSLNSNISNPNFFGLDKIFEDQNKLLTIFFVIFFLLFVTKFFYSIFFLYFKNKFLYGVRNNFSKRIFKNYLKKPFNFHQTNNTSKLAINCKYELDIFTSNIMSPVLELMTDIIIALGLFILLISIELKATLLIIFIFLIAVFIYQKVLKKKTQIWAKERQHFDRLINKVIREGLGSIKEIILNLKESFFINKLNYFLHRNYVVTTRAQISSDLPRHMLELVAIFGFVVIFYFLKLSGYQVLEILILVGLFAAVTFKILPSFNRIMSNIQRIRFGQPIINLLYSELALSPSEQQYEENINTNFFNFKNNIEIKNLFFKYEKSKEFIFKNANLKIDKGQFVGLSGESGVGKSTFLNIVSGLDKNYKGEILVDEKNLKDLNYSWTKNVAYISQNTFFLDDSIKNNIAFAEDEDLIDEKKIWASIEAAQLKNFVNGLEEGIDTLIGEDGTRMSGGQLQRLAIARALYQEFTLLILDESLNSLDLENENKIISILNDLKKDKIIFLISHKKGTLDNCDVKFKIYNKEIIKY